MSPPPGSEPPAANDALTSTTDLLRRAKGGDRGALESLAARYLPRLRRWASGRLPMRARSLFDTVDLVQETLLRTFENLDRVELRGPGGFEAYVRSAVLNRIRDGIRWADRRPGPEGIPETLADPGPSPLELAIGADLAQRYERAFATLSSEDQHLLHLRVELDWDYEEIRVMTGRESRDAVRMAVTRALRRLAEAMGHESGQDA
jgi:RNA polymerase sigma factor (sigma-70 family)